MDKGLLAGYLVGYAIWEENGNGLGEETFDVTAPDITAVCLKMLVSQKSERKSRHLHSCTL
jgi:hypothetical protein